MYAYLVDGFLHDKKYQTELLRIENRLAQLGIQGRFEKITILKNLAEAAKEAIRRGATTVVAVGNDQTVTKLLPLVVDGGVTLGLIPFGQPQTIAAALGIPTGLAACDVLSRRIIRHLDVGKVDNQYFLRDARLTAVERVECDGQYTVASVDPANTFVIGNLGSDDLERRPTDGRLELIVKSDAHGWSLWRRHYGPSSVFLIRRATIASSAPAASLLLDGQIVLKAPRTIEVAPQKLGVIVGRQRQI
ncbi:MAG: hypothetical protein HYY50_00555 [Candidatus Kerfeldbacteria bacterium]|nr:hypothetical protein [Candidatus Kerfeldbacteria bacterium]